MPFPPNLVAPPNPTYRPLGMSNNGLAAPNPNPSANSTTSPNPAAARTSPNISSTMASRPDPLRPSYLSGATGNKDEAARQGNVNRPGSTSQNYGPAPTSLFAAGNSHPHNHSHPSQPHHHHHHHHHHTHSAASDSASANPPPSYSSTAPSISSKPAATTIRPPDPTSGTSSTVGNRPGGYGRPSGFGIYSGIGWGYGISEAEERARAQRTKDGEVKTLPSIQTSPKASTTVPASGTFNRPALPPSPTISRTLPAPTVGPSAASKPSISPQPQPASTGSRSGLPIPGYSSLSRNLPSPFDRGPSPTVKPEPAAASHHRSLSSSSNRPGDPLPPIGGLTAQSPNKAAAQPTLPVRSLFGSYRPPGQESVQRSPVSHPAVAQPAMPSREVPAKETMPSAKETIPAPSPSGYSYPNAGLFGSWSALGSTARPFPSNDTRSREAERTWSEKERLERERIDRFRNEQEPHWKEALERSKLNADLQKEREAEKAQKQREQAQKRAENAAAKRQQKAQEVQQQKEQQQRTQLAQRQEPSTMQRALERWNAGEQRMYVHPDGKMYDTPPEPPAQYPPESKSTSKMARIQVPGYEGSTARDSKRSRMDMAVEEQANRRGSVPKAKRRKEDTYDRTREPVPNPLASRVWAKYVTPNVTEPVVVNTPVVSLVSDQKTPELCSEIKRGQEIYTGSTWNLGASESMRDIKGGQILVRIGGVFLGNHWNLRGEKAWPLSDERLGLPLLDSQRRLWGTGTYTDDSDLVSILVHDGWIRWLDYPADDQLDDSLIVTVGIAPTLVNYTGCTKFGVKSRNWGNSHDGLSIFILGATREKRPALHKTLTSSRKSRMALAAKERAAVLGDSSKSNAGEDSINLGRLTKKDEQSSAGFTYTPDSLLDYLDYSSPRNIWTHYLFMFSGQDTYRLAYDPNWDIPTICISQKKGEKFDDLVEDASPWDVIWLAEGLAIRSQGKKGFLCPISTYRWEPRTDNVRPEYWMSQEEEDKIAANKSGYLNADDRLMGFDD